jgi:hypothetical protein
VGDLDRWGDLLPTMQQVIRFDAAGPVGVGSRFRVRQPGLPKAVYEVTDWQPGKGFVWVSSSPGVRTTAAHWLESTDGGALLSLRLEWSGPLARIVRTLVGTKARRLVVREADTFTQLAEHAAHGG